MTDLLALPFPALQDCLDALGVGRVHAGRVFRALHGAEPHPFGAIPQLGRHGPFLDAHTTRSVARIDAVHPSDDGTERLVFALHDGTRVEGVLLPANPSGRVTLCLSSQVGCAMGCAFCATGTLGLTRQLSAGEIVAQVHEARARVTASGRRLTHLVFMGMGEPLHNHGAVRDALSILFDPHGQPMDQKRVTVSTVGLVDRIRQLGEDFGGRIQLAISLHAGTDVTRRRIIPLARKVSLAELKAAVLAWPLPGSRHLMIEVVVLPGINDGPDELDGLASWMDGVDGMLNLIPFNPFPGAQFRSPTDDEVRAMQAGLRARGVPVRVRWPRGRAASGACGQLMLAGVPGAPRAEIAG